jgi:putative DNA primase/helicase
MAYAFNDLGNASRFLDLYQDVVRFSPEFGWTVWNGKVWQKSFEAALNLAILSTKNIADPDVIQDADAAATRQIVGWQKSSQNLSRLRGLLGVASAGPEIQANYQIFDNGRHYLNCKNGILDLESGILEPHDPMRFMTRITNCDYREEAECPKWRAFMERVIPDPETRTSLQIIAGYAITGYVSERAMFIFYGMGANGKSTFLDTICQVLGDYSAGIPASSLMVKSTGAIPNDIAMLVGKRFATASESDASNRLSESFVKALTGDNTLTARFLHQEFFQYQPQFKLFLATNHKPTISGTDNAIWTRIKLVPWLVSIPREEWIHDFHDTLAREEGPGILRWLVTGAQAWFASERKIAYSQQITDETLVYREDQDVLGSFIDDCVECRDDAQTSFFDLYDAYKKWCEENGNRPLSSKRLVGNMKERGFSASRGGMMNCWQGIALSRMTPQTNKYEQYEWN